jgi:holo-[acyl-carrier protein] synthase
MSIFGIGVDVVEIRRVQQSIDRLGDAFLNRLFTPREREYCDRMTHSSRHYAARFAAKEAIAKALGTGIGEDLNWQDMEILRKPNGQPYVVVSGRGKQFMSSRSISRILISLSHADHYAAANAVACCEEV